MVVYDYIGDMTITKLQNLYKTRNISFFLFFFLFFSFWWRAVLEKTEMNDKNLTTSNSNNIVITSIYRYIDTKKTLLDI